MPLLADEHGNLGPAISRKDQIAQLMENTRLGARPAEKAKAKPLVSTPREHMPGYTGYVPGAQFSHALTYGKSTEIGLQVAHTPRDKAVTKIDYAYTSGGNQMREVHQSVPKVRGPTFTGFMTGERVVQGSDTDISAYYREISKQTKEVKDKLERDGKGAVPGLRKDRNMSHIKWGDNFAFQGSHMFLTTNEDAFVDKQKRLAESYPDQEDGGLMAAVNIQRYHSAQQSLGPVHLRSLQDVLRDKLTQRTGSGPGELRRKFKEFDRDQSGTIDPQEFAKVMEWFGIKLTQRELLALFGMYDEDGSGSLTYYEFVENLLGSGESDKKGPLKGMIDLPHVGTKDMGCINTAVLEHDANDDSVLAAEAQHDMRHGSIIGHH